MARATVTVRELKNKETGIDLAVTSYKETKGMLGSTYEYQVMVVSNLSYFKTPKHKDTDNVQFTVMKKLNDFEDMHNKFNTKYSGTVFPQLPKKVLMMNDTIVKERRNNLDHFMKHLACSPKLCTDSILLEFLGVSALKAGKLKKMVVTESTVNQGDNSEKQKNEIVPEIDESPESNTEDLFNDEDTKDDGDDDVDLFGTDDVQTEARDDLKLFDGPDLSGALEEGEGDELFIEGSRSDLKVKASISRQYDSDDDAEDLFGVDDDLDEIMKMKLNTKEKPPEIDDNVEEESGNENTEELSVETEPVVKPKPALKAKPVVPKRKDLKEPEKDSLDNKFDSITKETGIQGVGTTKDKSKPKPSLMKKPVVTDKPVLKPKPGLKPKPVLDNTKAEKPKESSDVSAGVEDITEDDIMKYIQDNTQDNVDDLDLFS